MAAREGHSRKAYQIFERIDHLSAYRLNVLHHCLHTCSSVPLSPRARLERGCRACFHISRPMILLTPYNVLARASTRYFAALRRQREA